MAMTIKWLGCQPEGPGFKSGGYPTPKMMYLYQKIDCFRYVNKQVKCQKVSVNMPKERCKYFYRQRLCQYDRPSRSNDETKGSDHRKIRILSVKEINEKYEETVICHKLKNIQINK